MFYVIALFYGSKHKSTLPVVLDVDRDAQDSELPLLRRFERFQRSLTRRTAALRSQGQDLRQAAHGLQGHGPILFHGPLPSRP